jgi:hypothetical protein
MFKNLVDFNKTIVLMVHILSKIFQVVLAEHFKRANRYFELAGRDFVSFVRVVLSEKLIE